MLANKYPFAILSAYRTEYNEDANQDRHSDAMAHLYRYDPMPAIGSYKGKTEQSIIVPLGDDYAWSHVLRVAYRYGQESVLHVDEHGYAHLHTLHESIPGHSKASEIIGIWCAVHEDVARHNDAWTIADGVYYVAI